MCKIVPDDWIYTVKKALNYRIYSNPIIVTDMIDIISEEVYNTFGKENVVCFNFDDNTKCISFTITNVDFINSNCKAESVHSNSMMRFCLKYEEEIKNAIAEQSQIYASIFKDMVEYNHPLLIKQLSMYFGHPVFTNNQFSVTFRLY